MSISGVEPVIATIDKIEIEQEDFFRHENNTAARVAFVERTSPKTFFRRAEARQRTENIRHSYRIIGIQVAKGTVFTAAGQFHPASHQNIQQLGGLMEPRTILPSPKRVSRWKTPSMRFDAASHKTQVGPMKGQFRHNHTDAISGMIGSMTAVFSIVLLLVPGIALVVGAIVIMNIMLVAVTERTKEIGIRKSLGARQADILRQFLFESGLLSAIGGFIGLFIAYTAGYIITLYVFPTSIPWYAAVLAIGVSGGVGILAGLFPAWKAAALDPIGQ